MMRKTNDAHRVPEESVEQCNLFQWAELQSGKWPELRLMYAVPNGGYRMKGTAVRMKKEGVKAGVPDICLPVARGCYHGLYIEMKRIRGGRTSGAQQGWITDLQEEGYRAVVCKGWCEAAEEIARYMQLPLWRVEE